MEQKKQLAFFYLNRLLEENQFEMWRTEEMDTDSWKITYMFNDAVESYLLLEQVIQTGQYDREQENVELR